MLNQARKLDLYGVYPKMTISGKSAFKTMFGAIVTVMAFCLFSVATYLFGVDFFHRKNPRIVSNESVSTEPKIIYPLSSNFTVFFEIVDKGGRRPDIDSLKTKFFFSYRWVENNEDNVPTAVLSKRIKPYKCSETKAVDNPNLKDRDLSLFYCLNWEELIEVHGGPVPLGGFAGDFMYSLFRIKVTNHTFDSRSTKDPPSKRSSWEEVYDEMKTNKFIMKIYFPSFIFDLDSYNEPIKQSYDSFLYNIAPDIRRLDRNFFEASFLLDDRGWIFEDIRQIESIRQDKYQTEITVQKYNPKDRMNIQIYTFISYLNKKNTIFRRSYMKIQELAAVAGGLIKIVNLFFSSLVGVVAKFQMESTIMNKISAQKQRSQVLKNNLMSQSSAHSISLVVQTKAKEKIELTFGSYFKRLIGLGKSKEVNYYEQKWLETLGKMDLSYFMHFFVALEYFLTDAMINKNKQGMKKKLETVFKTNY